MSANLQPRTDDNSRIGGTLYQIMCLIRRFETVAAEKYRDGKMPGFIHLSLGQEACAAGACVALEDRDYITSTHRGHGHCLAKGADPNLMMAELFGKSDGYCKGRGGSMHIADPSIGVLGANGIVGQSLPLAVGAALTAQVKKNGAVALAFFGEGASGAGVVHEAMNIAAIWSLPVVFFCEANRYAELSPYETHCPIDQISKRASSYGFPGITVNGEDAVQVYLAAEKAVLRARSGKGPSLIEAKTRRWNGHYEGDPQKYKTADERDNPSSFDPLVFFEKNYSSEYGLSEADIQTLRANADQTISEAVNFAENSPPSPKENILSDVYAPLVV